MPKPWFGPKRFGIGLSPTSVEGWAATLGYIVALGVAVPLTQRLGAPRWAPAAVSGALTVGFLALVFTKSDRQPWRWRWGGR